MFEKSSKIHKLKVNFNSHCEDERREDAAIQAKSTVSPRAKASRLTKKSHSIQTKSPYHRKSIYVIRGLNYSCNNRRSSCNNGSNANE